jgi:hypothetical protein
LFIEVFLTRKGKKVNNYQMGESGHTEALPTGMRETVSGLPDGLFSNQKSQFG